MYKHATVYRLYPKKTFAVTAKFAVPQENECQIWNQHMNVI